MKVGNAENVDKYGPYLLTTLRRTGLSMSIAVALYALATMYQLTPQSPTYYPAAAGFSVITFTLVGLAWWLHRKPAQRDIMHFTIMYHALAAFFVIWVAGFTSPGVFMWAMLTVISEIHFRRKGAILSVVTLSVVALLSVGLTPGAEADVVFESLLNVVVTTVLALAFIQLWSVQRVEQQALKDSRAEEELQRGQLLTLINSLNVAVVTTSSRGTVRLYNAAFLNLLDTNNSLSGRRIDETLALSDKDGEVVQLNHLVQDSGRPFERDDLMLKTGDGDEIRLQLSGAPIRSTTSEGKNRTEGYIFVMRDITKAKSLEEERDEFISVVSHELRTPITIAEGTISNLQLLLDKGGSPKTLSPALKDAHEQVLYLASMVNDLGTLSRAERGVGDAPEEIDVQALLTELYHRYRPTAERKHLVLNVEAGRQLGVVHTSRLYLEEILQNFITNAIKYTQEGSVTLCSKRDKDGVHFAVKDSGIGISKADQKRVFEKFYRSEDFRTRETSGTGLGLYVTKKLADKLGVKITVTSRLNHGSTFHFVLPDDSTDKSA